MLSQEFRIVDNKKRRNVEGLLWVEVSCHNRCGGFVEILIEHDFLQERISKGRSIVRKVCPGCAKTGKVTEN